MREPWQVLELLLRHRGKIIGAIVGVLLSWMVLVFGVWRTLFVVFCMAVGVYVGARIDGDENEVWRRRN
ncbi:MAG: DUF2273 domain-containing protein [Limnochordia bacterium]|jgi:uncharacterized membrane protein